MSDIYEKIETMVQNQAAFLQELRDEEIALVKKLETVRGFISKITGESAKPNVVSKGGKPEKPKRVVSAATKARMKAAAKIRWKNKKKK